MSRLDGYIEDLKFELLDAVKRRKKYYVNRYKNHHDMTMYYFYDGKVRANARAINILTRGY